MRTIFAAPTPRVGWREVAWVVGALLTSLAVIGASTPLGPAVPLALVLSVVGLGIAVTSSFHGLLVVVAAVVLVPLPFSIAVGPVTVSAGRALIFALVVGWLAQRHRPGADRLPRTALAPTVFVLLAAMVLSTVVNTPRMAPFELAGAFRKLGVYGVDFALLFVVATAVAASQERLLRLVRVVVGIVTATAVLGVVEFVSGRNVFEFLSPYLPGGIGRFIAELADASTLTRGQISRVHSTLEHPLAFGSLLLLGLPLAMSLSLLARERAQRARWAGAAALIGLAALLTAGRSVYAIAAIGLATMVLVLPERRDRRRILAVGAVVVVVFAAQPAVRETMLSFLQPRRGGVLEGSLQSRVDDYAPVLDRVAQRPLLGFGPRSFALDELAANGLLPDPENLVLDNAYLLTLAETGVTGLVTLIGVLAVAATASWRAAHRADSRDVRYVAVGLYVAVQSWILMGFAADVYLFNAPPRVFFVLLGAVATARRLAAWPSDRPSALSAPTA